MNHRNLKRVNAAHAFKAEATRIHAPGAQTFHVRYVAKDGVDGLHTGCVGGIDHALAGIERLRYLSRSLPRQGRRCNPQGQSSKRQSFRWPWRSRMHFRFRVRIRGSASARSGE